MKEVTDQLTDEGVKLFAEAFDKLLEAVDKRVEEGGSFGREEFQPTSSRKISTRQCKPRSTIGTRTTK